MNIPGGNRGVSSWPCLQTPLFCLKHASTLVMSEILLLLTDRLSRFVGTEEGFVDAEAIPFSETDGINEMTYE
jgi:hypothetical protein